MNATYRHFYVQNTFKTFVRLFPILCSLGCHTVTGMVAVRNEKAHEGPWEIWGIIA